MRTIPAPKSASPVNRGPVCEPQCSVATRPAGQSIEQSNNIIEAIDRLEKVASSLRDRLSCITAQRDAEPPSPCPPDACIVPFAESLRNHQRRINGIAANLEDLHASIEL